MPSLERDKGKGSNHVRKRKNPKKGLNKKTSAKKTVGYNQVIT